MPRKFAALFFSLTVVILGTTIFFHDMSINFYTAIKFLQFVVPASIAMGFLGFIIGKIFEKGHNKKGKLPDWPTSKAQLNIDDLLSSSGKDSILTESTEKNKDI